MKLYTEEDMKKAFWEGHIYAASIAPASMGWQDRYVQNTLDSFTPIELSSNEEMIPLENAFEFTQWMSGLIESNFMSNGNWYCNGEIKTTNQLYEIWMKEQILNQNK